MVMDADLMRIFDPGTQSPRAPVFDGPQEAEITRVSGASVFFKLPDWSPLRTFGPIVNNIPSPELVEVGQRCLIVFVAGDLARPWVIAWRS